MEGNCNTIRALSKEERLAALVSYCGRKADFGRRIGVKKENISQYLQRKTYNTVLLAECFPEISSAWILRGTGPMLEADLERDEDFALSTLGITRDQLASIRTSSTVSCDASHDNNEECTHPRAYEEYTPDIYHVAEGQAVDRALLNMLLAEKAHLQQELAVLRQRNLELEKLYAIEHDRLENAEHWYRTNIQKK